MKYSEIICTGKCGGPQSSDQAGCDCMMRGPYKSMALSLVVRGFLGCASDL